VERRVLGSETMFHTDFLKQTCSQLGALRVMHFGANNATAPDVHE